MYSAISKEKLAEKSKSKLPNQASVPLSERNVNLWSTLPENTKNNTQNLMRWRNSMNLAENEELRSVHPPLDIGFYLRHYFAFL